MKTVIHHSADFDGIFCREIAKKFLGTEGVNYIGWDFKDPRIPQPKEGTIYILDLSPVCLEVTETNPACESRMIWIDHHKTSIEAYSPKIPGYRIDGVAACRLAWQWFTANDFQRKHATQKLADRRDFIERLVDEPLAVRLAGEYDIWDHRGDGDLEFQFGLRSEKDLRWDRLLDAENDTAYARQIIAQGKLIMDYSQGVDAGIVNNRSFITEFEGLKFLTLNTARCNSLTFAAKDVPETGHDALLAFYFTGKEYIVSMYHASHRKDLDLAAIAVRHGGGGHRGACGFQADKLPFLP